jgi:hypothetical protein
VIDIFQGEDLRVLWGLGFFCEILIIWGTNSGVDGFGTVAGVFSGREII